MISVVVPVYNPGKWFDSCIESLLGQTYTDTEILLIDDGSTDGSEKACDDFSEKDDRIRVFHTENHGASHARNIGIREARGEYVAFVDSDDRLESDTFAAALNRIRSDNSQLAIYAMQIDRYTGDRVAETPLPLAADELVSQKDIAERFGELFYADYLSSSCTKLFDRRLLIDNGLFFDESLVSYEDLHFVLRYMLLTEKISLMKQVCYHYRMDTSVIAISKRKTNDLLSNIDTVANGVLAFLKQNAVDLTDSSAKVILDLYLIYLHKLFVSPERFFARIKGIRKLSRVPLLRQALIRCRSFAKQGKFYKMIAFSLKTKLSLPIYVLYRQRY